MLAPTISLIVSLYVLSCSYLESPAVCGRASHLSGSGDFFGGDAHEFSISTLLTMLMADAVGLWDAL